MYDIGEILDVPRIGFRIDNGKIYLGKKPSIFPEENAIIDTGNEGFVVLPKEFKDILTTKLKGFSSVQAYQTQEKITYEYEVKFYLQSEKKHMNISVIFLGDEFILGMDFLQRFESLNLDFPLREVYLNYYPTK